MTITTYRVTTDAGFTDFGTELLAQNFCTANGLSFDHISPITKTLVDTVLVDDKIIKKPWLAPINARQVRLQVVASGHSLADIDTAIAALSDPLKTQVQITWQYGSQFMRQGVLTNLLASALGWTEDQLDVFWAAAILL